jgi:RNA-directed DNA polymerase
VNTSAPWPTPEEAEARVLGIQTKLHRWPPVCLRRRFGDLFNLVCDPAFLLVGWRRVRGNKGARTAGVDGQTAFYVERVRGEEAFLADLRAELKARTFRPLAVRERMIPKPGGKLRRLGIPTVRDRVVQAALKLVLEPIFEADFRPCSYGFRPGRRAQDAIAEIHLLASRGYGWVLEGDITACFDEIDHVALMDRVRGRIADKRVLALVKAFHHRHPARRRPVPAAGQHRPVGPGRARRWGLAGDGSVSARHRRRASAPGDLAAGPLRRRRRRHGGRHPDACRAAPR